MLHTTVYERPLCEDLELDIGLNHSDPLEIHLSIAALLLGYE